MYRLFYLLEMPLERTLRMSAMTCGELAGYEKQESRKSVSRYGAFFFPRWGRRVFDFSALSFADMEKRESFLAVMERASHPFFAEEETDIRRAVFESHELTTHHFSDTRRKKDDTLQARGKEITGRRMQLSRIEGNKGPGKGEEYAVRFVACCVVDFSSADGI